MVGDSPNSEGSGGALALYKRIANPMDAIKVMGNTIWKSQMLGEVNLEQAELIAWECLARNMPLLSFGMRYHIIKGKLSMKSDIMLAEFHRQGGVSKIIERTPERASVQMVTKNDSQTFSFTWEEAQNEPYIYEGKESAVVAALLGGKKKTLTIKPKYATPRSRMQMLWARVVSDGVRAMMSEVNGGYYTPEEVDDFEDDGSPSNTIVGEFTVVPAAEVADQPGMGGAATETVVTTILADAAADNVKPIVTDGVDGIQYATGDQTETFELLIAQLNVTPNDRDKILQKRAVNSPRSLTVDQIREINTTLSNKIQKIQDQKSEEEKRKEREAIQAVEANHAQRLSESEQQAAEMSVVSDELEAAVKAELQKLKQVKREECDAIIALIQAATPSGKIKGMSTRNAKEMLQHMQAGTAAKFIAKYTGELKLDSDPIPF